MTLEERDRMNAVFKSHADEAAAKDREINQLQADRDHWKARAEAAEAERDALARYINGLDIDEDVCKKHPECRELDLTEKNCVACIIRTLGRGLKGGERDEH